MNHFQKVRRIRELFPEPQSQESAPKYCGYCVGGAWMLYHGDTKAEPFPTADDLAGSLMAHTGVVQIEAFVLAEDIVAANDKGDIEDAWKLLGCAVT